MRRRLRRARTLLRGALTVGERLTWLHHPMRSALHLQDQDRHQNPDLVRWLDSVPLGRDRGEALFMHPPSSRTFEVTVPPGGRFRARIGLMPEVWDKNRHGVLFSIQTDRGPLGRPLLGAWQLDPRRDRSGRSVELDLSALAGQRVQLTLETTVPPGGTDEFAWALWWQPELVERRPRKALLRHHLATVFSDRLDRSLLHYRDRLAAAGRRETEYETWLRKRGYFDLNLKRQRAECAELRYQPTISIITPVHNTASWMLRACVESVVQQSYPHWELCLADDGSTNHETLACLAQLEARDPRIKLRRLPRNVGIAAASNAALDLATGDFVGLLDHDDELTPDALAELVRSLNDQPDVDVIYTDEDKLEPDGALSEPFFKPDWVPEYLQSVMYFGHLTVYRRSLVEAVGRFRPEFDGSQDYDLALRVTERTDRIVHLPRVLYHWRKAAGSAAGATEAKPWALAAAQRALEEHLGRVGQEGSVEYQPETGYWRLHFAIREEPLVSIIVPTHGEPHQTADGPRELLLRCLQSVVERTTYRNFELLVVDDGQLPPETRRFLQDVPHRQITFPYSRPFNFSRKINFSVGHARGQHLVLLNDDTEVISPEWLGAMLEFSQQETIGAVGAKLYYHDGRIQHAGVVIGIGCASHVFAGVSGDHSGYFGSTRVIRNYSAVTAACMMTRREAFERAGGFDEHFATDLNDVDYCLRLGTLGYRVVYTPYAELYHYDGASFGSRVGKVNQQEINRFSSRWGHVMADDPCYNPNLTLTALDYGLRA